MAMLVVATALTVIGRSVHTTPWNEDQFDDQYIAKLFHEDDMTPEFTEQLGSHDHTSDVTTRRGNDKYGPLEDEAKTITQRTTEKSMHPVLEPNASTVISPKLVYKVNASDYNKKPPLHINHEDRDVADREDHVTQYLADQMVNTDSEITALEVSETEDDSGSVSVSNEITADKFFAFLTGLEEAVEVEGVWSKPNTVDYNIKNPINKYETDNGI